MVLRRRKSDPEIAPELPPKTISTRAAELTQEQIGLYQALVDEHLASISQLEYAERRGRILALLTALKQVCNHPVQYLKESDAELDARSGKLEALGEILNITSTEGSPALVFTQFVAMGNLIAGPLI